jgi:hypothetical protein
MIGLRSAGHMVMFCPEGAPAWPIAKAAGAGTAGDQEVGVGTDSGECAP